METNLPFMDIQLQGKLLTRLLQTRETVDIGVVGYSMQPLLYEGDQITVCQCAQYAVGEVLVYQYGNSIITHRILKTEDGYLCKGDNAIRVEHVTPDQVYGKAIAVNGSPIAAWPMWKVNLSYKEHLWFRSLDYNSEIGTKGTIYKVYAELVLHKGDNTMQYQKTQAMDLIPTDETSLAVFDPETGNTYFFDETGTDILNCLAEPCTLEALLEKLCTIYNATPDDIRADVEEFLADVIEKKVVDVV